MLGIEQVSAPPPFPQFPDNPVGALAITNASGVISLKLACPSTPAANTAVRAAAPCSQGLAYCDDYRFLGVLPSPVQGACDITSLYTARYGSPAVGTKVFVRVNQNIDGWEDAPVETSAIGAGGFPELPPGRAGRRGAGCEAFTSPGWDGAPPAAWDAHKLVYAANRAF